MLFKIFNNWYDTGPDNQSRPYHKYVMNKCDYPGKCWLNIRPALDSDFIAMYIMMWQILLLNTFHKLSKK